MQKKNIAIIGGGGAGSAAAWSLSRIHNVSLFESEATLGGHAYTEKITIDNQEIAIDLAVEYFSEKQSPNLFALLNHFKIGTFVAPLSFGAAYDNKGSFWSNNGINGTLWDKISSECNRFQVQMHEVMHLYNADIKKMTIGEFLKKEGYSNEFIYKALLPILTTFTSGNSPILEYSLTFCALSFSMSLLSFFHPTYWRKACGGISSYLLRIYADLKDNIHLNSKVSKVTRNKDTVSVYLVNGQKYDFDEVIFATHANTSLALIDNPSKDEISILGNFEYTSIQCVFHLDKTILIPEFNSKVYCEFNGINSNDDEFNGTLTRVIPSLDIYKNIKQSLLVSFDPKMPISPDLIYAQKHWEIPKLRPKDMANKRKIKAIQGVDRIWFCGTDTSFTGHEGALLSGLVVADALGAKYPFENNNWAKVQYDIVKGIMGIYSPYEQICNSFSNGIYSLAKVLGIHKSQISKVLLDLYA
jgi:predicted NAD/FAD-binding protein